MIWFFLSRTRWNLALCIVALSLQAILLSAAPDSAPVGSAASLDHSILLGSDTQLEFGLRIAVDAAGAAYLTGTRVDTNTQTSDVFVRKLSSDGKTVLYDTALGGMGNETAGSIAVDSNGNAYVTGTTLGNDFPLEAPIQFRRYGASDAFVVKLDPDGQIVYSTLLGGVGDEQGRGIAVDQSGGAYVTGFTNARDFLVPNVRDAPVPPGTYQGRLLGPTDAFVVKVNPQGTEFEFKTFLGGTQAEIANAIAVDPNGSCVVFGITGSLDFPRKNPVQGLGQGQGDAFIVKFNPQGSDIEFATYLGGSGAELISSILPLVATGGDIALDAEGNVYVAGDTASTNFPVTAALQPKLNGTETDGFVAKISPDGSTLLYATYLGGATAEFISGIAVDASGGLVLTGTTSSTNWPVTSEALQSEYGGSNDVFVAWLDASGRTLEHSTYLGGPGVDGGNAIAAGPGGAVFVTGITDGREFPISTNPPSTPRAGFFARLSRAAVPPPSVRFQSFRLNSNKEFEMQLLAPSGRTHRLEVSPNLRDWILATEFTSTNGRFQFTDPRAALSSVLFYRTFSP